MRWATAFLLALTWTGCTGGDDSEPARGLACAPGRQEVCACPGGSEGVQVCLDDGSGFAACEGCDVGPEPCTVADDCPGEDTVCGWRTCEAGVCGVGAAPLGTAAGDEQPGDCMQLACNGSGAAVVAIDDDDAPTPPECQESECVDGEPGYFEALEGTPCSSGSCDGSGNCVPN